MTCGGEKHPRDDGQKQQVPAPERELGKHVASKYPERDRQRRRRHRHEECVDEVAVNRGVEDDLREIAEMNPRRELPKLPEGDLPRRLDRRQQDTERRRQEQNGKTEQNHEDGSRPRIERLWFCNRSHGRAGRSVLLVEFSHESRRACAAV